MALVLDMSMPLDGHQLADGNGDDPTSFRPDGPSGEVFDEMMATGAVLVGRGERPS
jgi:hypothetical protein